MRFLLLSFFLLSSIALFGQKNKPDLIAGTKIKSNTDSGSSLLFAPLEGVISPLDIKEDWKISLRHQSAYFHNSDLTLEEYKLQKDEANLQRIKAKTLLSKERAGIVNQGELTPFLNTNFRGNLRGGSIPMDNTMAVSRNGFIVSAINSNIIFALPDGTLTYTRNLSDFYKILGLGTAMFDPRILYDPEQHRFIVVTLHGSDPNNSFLCLAFSKSEDPNGEWNFYKLKGDQANDDVWFDFPNIAVSKEDLFIGGNMFTAENGYRYSMILQISKTECYNGQMMSYKYFDGISNTTGGNVFNPVPVMSGWESLTSEMYFISNGNGGFNINTIEQPLENNPSIKARRITGASVTTPAEARQKNTDVMLNTGGNRLRCAIIQNNIIHFAAQTNTSNGDVGIYYGRADLKKNVVLSTIISEIDKDYAYPTITSFGDTEDSDLFLLNYTYSGPNDFPGQAVRTVSGKDAVFNWSEENITKSGSSAINASSTQSIRWGDYSGASRRFINDRKESWVCGTYGAANVHNTWIGQYVHQNDTTRPLMDFTGWPSSTQVDSTVVFKDITNSSLSARTWIFEGGNPAVSNDESPKVKFSENGKYDIILIHQYPDRNDTFVKTEFINIFNKETAPVANWISDKDTIFVGDEVLFTSLSSENSYNHNWTFINGTPSKSTQREQLVQYKKKGTFLVALNVNNIAGSNTLTRSKAVTVLEKLAPNADFSAEKLNILQGETIKFNNLSKNGTSYSWTFPGGIPFVSSEISPFVTYPNPGEYEVRLKVINDFGVDSIVKSNFITVGVTSTEETNTSTKYHLFPNPVNEVDQVNLSFDNVKSQRYVISLINSSGELVKVLYDNKVKQGANTLSFNAGMLSSGSYFIVITDGQQNKQTIQLQVVD